MDALITDAMQGDTNAFGELYRMLAPRIHRFASFRCSDDTLAEDLTHETFVQAHRALTRYEHRSADLFVQWLYGIARRVVAGYYRRRRPTEQVSPNLPAAGSAGAEGIDRIAGDLAVREAVEALTPDQRQVVELRFFRGMSHEEIANVVDRRSGAVRSLQFRALQALRETLE